MSANVVIERPAKSVNSHNRRAPVPEVGSVWCWEPTKAHARQRVEVTQVKWNGEEWWIRTKGLPTRPMLVDTPFGKAPLAALQRLGGDSTGAEFWNDLGRFWEAVRADAPKYRPVATAAPDEKPEGIGSQPHSRPPTQAP